MEKKSNITKHALITGLARLHGLRMADLARECGVHVCTMYRVAHGVKSSKRVDAFLSRKLGLRQEVLRQAGK